MKLSIRELRALRMFINLKDIRDVLHGIKIDPKGCAVATDGHRMAVLSNLVEGEDFFIPVQVIDEIVKLYKGKAHYDTTVYFTRDTYEVGTFKRQYPVDKEDRFPDWRKVIPTPDLNGRVEIAFNMQYLADAEKAFSLLADKSIYETHTKLIFGIEQKATTITCSAVPDFIAYVMEKRI